MDEIPDCECQHIPRPSYPSHDTQYDTPYDKCEKCGFSFIDRVHRTLDKVKEDNNN